MGIDFLWRVFFCFKERKIDNHNVHFFEICFFKTLWRTSKGKNVSVRKKMTNAKLRGNIKKT